MACSPGLDLGFSRQGISPAVLSCGVVQRSDQEMVALHERLQQTEQSQQQVLSILSQALQDPAFLRQLLSNRQMSQRMLDDDPKGKPPCLLRFLIHLEILHRHRAGVAQLVEHALRKGEVQGSMPCICKGTFFCCRRAPGMQAGRRGELCAPALSTRILGRTPTQTPAISSWSMIAPWPPALPTTCS